MASALNPIGTITVNTAVSEVVVGNLPQGYRALYIIFTGSCTSGSVNHFIQFNGDASGSYYWIGMGGNGSSALAGAGSGQTTGVLDFYGYLNQSLTNTIITVMDYSSNTKLKTWLSRPNNASNGVSNITGRWNSLNPITSLRFFPNGTTFTAGSTFKIFGVSA